MVFSSSSSSSLSVLVFRQLKKSGPGRGLLHWAVGDLICCGVASCLVQFVDVYNIVCPIEVTCVPAMYVMNKA